MNLREYAASLPPGGQAELARNIGVAHTFLYQMIRGIRPVPSQLCRKIELATYGAVTAAELRPDLAAIFGPPATAAGRTRFASARTATRLRLRHKDALKQESAKRCLGLDDAERAMTPYGLATD